MTALAPWNWEIGSTAIESVVSRFWRFAGGGENMGDDGKRLAGSTFLPNRVRNILNATGADFCTRLATRQEPRK
jgi:hypothetical protein